MLFAREEPELAAVLTKLDGAEDVFAESVLPYARKTVERGQQAGRFQLEDLDLTLVSVIAGAFATMKAVLAGRVSEQADVIGAEMMLRAFGLQAADAREIARRPLPVLDLHADGA